MSKLSDAIKDQTYILECLKSLKEMYDSGCCNTCGVQKCCDYAPKPGQLVRYNCPFYKGKDETNMLLKYGKICCRCKHYQGAHGVLGHAPCDILNEDTDMGTDVMWNCCCQLWEEKHNV